MLEILQDEGWFAETLGYLGDDQHNKNSKGF